MTGHTCDQCWERVVEMKGEALLDQKESKSRIRRAQKYTMPRMTIRAIQNQYNSGDKIKL